VWGVLVGGGEETIILQIITNATKKYACKFHSGKRLAVGEGRGGLYRRILFIRMKGAIGFKKIEGGLENEKNHG